jgi:hypothetical protein
MARSSASDKYRLVILQDACSKPPATEKYRLAGRKPLKRLKHGSQRNKDHFVSVRFERSEENNGPIELLTVSAMLKAAAGSRSN